MARGKWMLVALLGAAALMPAANETFARSGAAPGGFSALRPIRNASAVPWFRHHQRHSHVGATWLGAGGYYDGVSNGERFADAPPDAMQPMSRDIRYTYT